MTQQDDQVFQLSLTEIAFTIAFILLLLLGYLVFKEQSERLAAEAALAKVQSTERATAALHTVKGTLGAALRDAGASNPDEVITKLIAADEVKAERDRLKEQVEDLDAKLTALAELQNQLEKAAKSTRPDITKEEMDSALALQEQVRKAIEQETSEEAKPSQQAASQVTAKASSHGDSSPSKGQAAPSAQHGDAASHASTASTAKTTSSSAASPKPSREQRNKEALGRVKQAIAATGELKKQLKKQLGKDLKPGQEAQTVQEVVSAAKNYGDLAKTGAGPNVIKKENSDLRGQVAFLKNKLDARGGRDHPPCWADENGKVEFLFSVEVKADNVVVVPAWPPKREADARALPGVAEALAGPHSNQNFVARTQGIFNKSQELQCRHYVQLKSSIADAVQSDRARLMVENYFYKVEVRR